MCCIIVLPFTLMHHRLIGMEIAGEEGRLRPYFRVREEIQIFERKWKGMIEVMFLLIEINQNVLNSKQILKNYH